MPTAVQNLLASFDSLSEAEKQEAGAELLSRILAEAPAQISDESLTTAAEELFLELDSPEATYAGS